MAETIVYQQPFALGPSSFTAVGVYDTPHSPNIGVAATDPLYPEIVAAEGMVVSGGQADCSLAGGDDYASSGIVVADFPAFDATQGYISCVYTPNATSLAQAFGHQPIWILDQPSYLGGVPIVQLYVQGPGGPYTVEMIVSGPAPGLGVQGATLSDQTSAFTFVAGTPYTFKLAWKSGLLNGWVRLSINGALVHEVLNIQVGFLSNRITEVWFGYYGLLGALDNLLFVTGAPVVVPVVTAIPIPVIAPQQTTPPDLCCPTPPPYVPPTPAPPPFTQGLVLPYDGPEGLVPLRVDPVAGESLAGKSVDVWIEIDQPGTSPLVTIRKALVELADLPTYFGGRKPAGLSAIGALDHGLGTDTGTFAASAADLTFVDSQTDRTWRDLLATTDLEGDEARIYAASQHARDANLAPRLLFRGITQQPSTSAPLQATLSVIDALFTQGAPFGPQRLWPPLIPAIAAWIGTPPAALTKGLPWLYGEKSDVASVDPATNQPSVKGLCPLIYVGQETLTTSVPVPPYVYDPASPRTLKNAATVTIAGSTWGAGVGYPFFAIASVYGAKISMPILFDNTLRFPGQAPTVGPPYNERVVWDVYPNATIPDAFVVFMFDPSNWNPFTNPYVAAHPRFKVVLPVVTNPAGPPDVAGGVDVNAAEPWAYQCDWTSTTDGDAWPPSGDTLLTTSRPWDAYVAFGHPVARIEQIFGSDLGNGIATATPQRVRLDPDARSDLLVPGFDAWPFPESYRAYTAPDGTVYWLTVIYATGPLSADAKAGTVTFAVNAVGREDVGDGTGLPIVAAHAAEQAWLENEILGYWTAGPLADDVTFPQWADGTPKVRASRFRARQGYTVAQLGGRGLEAHWYADTPAAVESYVQAWDSSTETEVGVNGFGQITLGWIDELADPTTWPAIDHLVDIFGPVTAAFGVNRENQVQGHTDWDPDGQIFRTPVLTLSSAAGYAAYKSRWLKGTLIASTILGSQPQLAWVLAKRLARLQVGEIQVAVPGTVRLLDYDVDDPGVLLTTIEGRGASGYVRAPMWLRRRSVDLKTRLVTYTLLDVGDVLYATRFPGGLAQVPIVTDTTTDIGAPLVTNDLTLAPAVVI